MVGVKVEGVVFLPLTTFNNFKHDFIATQNFCQAWLQDQAHVVSAYNICLRLQDSLEELAASGVNVDKDLVCVRILGYLIHHVPTDTGLKNVVQEISSCLDNVALIKAGQTYRDHYIRAFRSKKASISTPSSHASRRSFDTIQEMIKATLKVAPQSYSQAKKQALIRDGYRCVVTKLYDLSSVEQIKEVGKSMSNQPGAAVTSTECAHIFSESTNMSIELGSAKLDYTATMWAVMRRIGYKELPEELNGSNIHRLENVMTLDPSFHTLFDNLKICRGNGTTPNEYRLESIHPHQFPRVVTFPTPDPITLPLPSPSYLTLHAACAKVAHLSGVAACIDKFYKDMEDGITLDPDGASAAALENALLELQAAGYEITV